ncbi:MAG: DUF4339 domain-containing protein [Hyphomicrobiaceae bacterium]|nr:DUF4339 domain-containing protein [Hyphomicrobiaceae bacterium]MCC0007276.1 DUF4339 domain-containing protein [Hyphomicrobiaceae bacterium]
MTGNTTDNLWYIARDGQQHGPISDTELQLFVTNGYLRPTDLLWRPGFADWRQADAVFPGQVGRDALPGTPPRSGDGSPNDPPAAARTTTPSASPASGRGAQAQPDMQRMSGGGAPAAQGQPASTSPATSGMAATASSPATSTSASAGAGAQRSVAQPYATAAAGVSPARSPEQRATSSARPTAQHTAQDNKSAPRPSAQAGSYAAPLEPAQISSPVTEAGGSGRGMRLALAGVLVALIGGSGAYLITHKDAILGVAGLEGGKKAEVPVIRAETTPKPAETAALQVEKPRPQPAAIPVVPGVVTTMPPAPATSTPAPSDASANTQATPDPSTRIAATESAISPTAASADAAAAMDTYYQKSKLWQHMKRVYPDWYGARMAEAAALGGGNEPARDATKSLVEGLVGLRRKHADAALQADMGRLKAIATAFLENLQSMSENGADACYSFISQGEVSAKSVDMFHRPQSAPALEAQALAIFEAIDAGTARPTSHERPKKGDYDVLASELGKLGWSQADLQLFADPKALAKAPPARVCTMVRDWFKAHIAISDAAVQERLLFETLRPVVAG